MTCKKCGPSRRDVLVYCAGTLAMIPAAQLITGCGEDTEGLTEDFLITISEHPELSVQGSSLLLDAGIALPIAVTRVGEGEADFIVTGTECNHANCGVSRNSDGWLCPCHGSRFALDGALEQGPATAGLTVYDYEVSGDVLTVLAE